MGCLNSKNIGNDSESKYKEEKINHNYSKKSSEDKKSPGGKKSGSNKSSPNKGDIKFHYTDLIGEKNENINKIYNLLMPPLGKGC